MSSYIQGNLIRTLRERKGLTQQELGRLIGVTDKTVSKWENDRGLPDISLLQPLSHVLNISVQDILSGECRENRNRSANIKKCKLYVCPICGNVICAVGDATISCCGITLPSVEPEQQDDMHRISVEKIDDEWFVDVQGHSMDKDHYISFLAYLTTDGVQIHKLYPEGQSYCRFPIKGHGIIRAYCNRHGLFQKII